MALKLQTSDAKSNGKALKTWICVLHFLKVDIMAQLVKNPPARGRPGSILGLGRSPGEGKGYPFQYSGLENSKDCIVHGVTESDITE